VKMTEIPRTSVIVFQTILTARVKHHLARFALDTLPR
jgi:hypothetical protein